MAKITVRSLDAAKPKDKPYKITVDRGLYLLIACSGSKNWRVRFMIDGKQYQAALPLPYGSGQGYMSLAQATAENARIQGLAKQDIDFRKQKQEVAQQEKMQQLKEKSFNAPFSSMCEAWLEFGVSRMDGNAEIIRSFEKDVLPVLGKKPVRNITEQDLHTLLVKMVKQRDVKRMCVRLYKDLVQLFAWAEKREPWRGLLVAGNPADLIDIKQVVGPHYDIYGRRDRILSEDEIRELHTIFNLNTPSTHEAALTSPQKHSSAILKKEAQLAVWICLSTACRIGELLRAKWEDVDLEQAQWFIPKENVKGTAGKKQDHLIFLSNFALEQFTSLHQITGGTHWCFPGKDRSSHIDVKSISKLIGDRQIQFKNRSESYQRYTDNSLVLSNGGNGEWTPHDLRRTAATMMQALKVPLDVIDRCQNHVLQGSKVRRHYLHYDYAQEKKEAWEKLGAKIEAILCSK